MPFDPLFINASAGVPAYTANELRAAMALGMMYDGRAVGARQGVRPGGTGFQVTVDGSLNITVKAGIASVDPGLSTPQGPYRVAMVADDSTTLDVSPHDPTNPRIDIVFVRVRDNDEDGSGLREAAIGYTAGTPAGSPVQPSTPASALLLASLAVPAVSGAVAVTDRRVWTVATGGILPVNVAGDIAAGVAGRYRHRLDTGVLEVDTGAAWVSTGASPRMGVTLRRVAAQTLPDVTDTTVSWDTEDVDTNGMFAPTGTTVTIPTGGGGLWAITFGIITAAVSTGRSLLYISPSNAPWSGAGRLRNSFGASEDTCTVSGTFPMSAGDTFTCVANVDMAGASTMAATLTAYRVGP